MTLTKWLIVIGGFIVAAIWLRGTDVAPSSAGGDTSTPPPPPDPFLVEGGNVSDLSPSVSAGVLRLATAISVAEGYGADPSNAPTRANNPGSLKLNGYPTTGAEGISVFPTPAAGWNALYHEIQVILSGESDHYQPEMTIAQMAQVYTDTQGVNWAANVVAGLRVSGIPDATTGTTIAEATA